MRDTLPRPERRPALTPATGPVTVIGIGNEWRRDDAVGLVVARRLRVRRLPGVRVLERSGEPAALVDAWRGAVNAIVIDAARSGARPGTVHRLDGHSPVAGRPVRDGCSSHALGVTDAIDLAGALTLLPERLELLSIEGGDFGRGHGLTPAVEAAADRLAHQLAERLA